MTDPTMEIIQEQADFRHSTKRYHGEIGCIFDGNRGQYISQAIQEMALAYGWPEHLAELSPDAEWYHDAGIEAEDWLNTNIAEPGHSFGCGESGDFFYMPNAWRDEG
jgi:hypothetical protein